MRERFRELTLYMNNWNLRNLVEEKIKKKGGWVNAHAHFDKAYTTNPSLLKLAHTSLKNKWTLVDDMKKSSTVSQIYDRMAYATESMIAQEVQAVGTFIDVDEMMKDKSIKAASKIRDKYKKDIKIKFINQALKGVLDKKAREWFMIGAEFADILGGLPRKDHPREKEHIDFILATAKKMGKMAHLHVDQFNDPAEVETEMLADAAIKHGMKNKAVAVHSISVAAHKKSYREALYKKMKAAGLMVVSCPTAWIDARRSEELQPFHNSIAPVEEMVAAGLTVALGTDNIADLVKPFTDGTMWTELRLLLEACRMYNIDSLTKIATVNGLKTLGLS